MVHGAEDGSDTPNLAEDVGPRDRLEDRVHVSQCGGGERRARDDRWCEDPAARVSGVAVGEEFLGELGGMVVGAEKGDGRTSKEL